MGERGQPMNTQLSRLKLLPTPKTVHAGEGAIVFRTEEQYPVVLLGDPGESFAFCGTFLENAMFERHALQLRPTSGASDWKDIGQGIVVCNRPALLGPETIGPEDESWFQQPLAFEQGYMITFVQDGPVVIAAHSNAGCLYGAATLLQLARREDGGAVAIDRAVVRDSPDFRYRGNTWTIAGELGIWSYDRGDGIEAYKERIVRKLDLMLSHKVNLVYTDAFGWDANRFPGYADMLLALNREARRRNIRLVSGGYYADYACSGLGDVYQGHIFKNRLHYPDGEEYLCVGIHDDGGTRGRRYGNCFSNRELLRSKLDELQTFVSAVEPGALYLHGIDADRMSLLDWSARCPACRERWPDDAIDSAQGAAGAFAHFFSELVGGINEIRKDGYDAAADCLHILVSPGYAAAESDDEEFGKSVRFWSAVSKQMTVKDNVVFMFREQFVHHDSRRRRFETLTNALRQDGNGHAAGVIFFGGGDGFKSDKLFQATSVWLHMFEGCEMVLCPNGNGFQEPMQLCNAEFLWNSKQSAFYRPGREDWSYEEVMAEYHEFMQTAIRPEGIYGKEGLLETACRYLYGPEAGAAMADVYRLSGDHGEPPVVYAANVDLKMSHFRHIFPMRWDNVLSAEDIDQLVEQYDQMHRVTKQAKEKVDRLLAESDVPHPAAEEIAWFASCLDIGVRHTGLLFAYMSLFRRLDAALPAQDADGERLEGIRSDIRALSAEVARHQQYAEQLGLTPIDLLGGAMARRKQLFEFLSYNLDLMDNSAAIRNRMPANRKELPARAWS